MITAIPFWIFPNVLASGVYFSYGDWRKGTYWIAAGVLTTVVTY